MPKIMKMVEVEPEEVPVSTDPKERFLNALDVLKRDHLKLWEALSPVFITLLPPETDSSLPEPVQHPES
jgi:hypothetical protein